ncbi:MAG: alpha/beta fold hydrolase, partial [Promethearchaeota archaeon]
MPYASSDGLQIYYEIFGQGKPIFLTHGWGSDLTQNWVNTGWVEVLQSVRRVIAIDCRGHGQSDKPLDQKLYSYGIMARDIIHLMDHLKIAKADLFGYSMGAFMAVYLLGHKKERFSSMILGGIGDETEKSKDATFIANALRVKNPSQISNLVGRAYRTYVDLNPNNDLEALALSALQMWPEGYPVQL